MLKSNWLVCCTCVLGAIGAPHGVPSAWSQSPAAAQVFDINIPAQPLASALAALSKATGVQVLAAGDLVAGKQAPAISGRLTARDALTRMLSGSGLEASASDGGFIVQRAAPAPQGEQQLPEVKVQASSERVGELPRPYAGGQVARGGRLGILGNRDMMDTPFSQSNYTAELMQNQQARFVADALDNDPSAHATNMSTGYDGFNFRGFPLSNGMELFNGLQGIDLGGESAIPAEQFERIEVLKGPNALLNGNLNTTGGVINLVPKRAREIPLTQFTVDYRSASQFGGHIDIGRRFGTENAFGIRFNGVYRDGDTYIDHQSRKTALAALGLDFRGERLRVEADFGHQRVEVHGARGSTRLAAGVPVPIAPDNRTNWFDPSELSDAETPLYGVVRGEYDLTNRWTAFVNMGGSERHRLQFNANRIVTNAQGDLAPGVFDRVAKAIKLDSGTAEGGLRGRFETGSVEHQLVVAYSTVFIEEQRSARPAGTPFPASNIYNPVYGASPNPSFPGWESLSKVAENTSSSFVLADTLSILEGRAQLTVGARLQQVKATNFNLATGAVTSRYDEDAVTPMVGVVVKPWESVSLYGSYIEGLQQGPVAPSTAANAGEIFAPYASKQYEIGAKKDFGRFATTVALYQIAQPNAFTDVTTNVFGLNGEQRHRGVDFNFFGDMTKDVRLLGGVAYIDSELTKTAGGIFDGKSGVVAPEWRGVLGAEWDTPFLRGLTVTGRVIRNGSAYLNDANTQKTPYWTRLDIGARYRINKMATIRADLKNALDKNYWTAGGDRDLILSEPRTFALSATFDF